MRSADAGDRGIVGRLAVWPRRAEFKCPHIQPAGLFCLSRAEEALRMSEEKFARAFAGNPAAIALTRFEDALVLEANETYCESAASRLFILIL
jgi:PAS domain-containing protein